MKVIKAINVAIFCQPENSTFAFDTEQQL